jgi:Protein of unknown function (DUF3667)
VNSNLREEKNCLNCGAEISDRYCSHCGQENLVPKETFGHLVGHFISDIIHYDSKFFITIRDLLFRPGFLTREYLNGKRIRYLNPIRMYIFISFIFFIALFARKKNEDNTGSKTPARQNLNVEKQYLADSLKKILLNPQTQIPYERIKDSLIRNIAASLDTPVTTVEKDESIGFAISSKGFLFTLKETRYNTVQEYDSAQKSLPEKERDGFIGRQFIRKNISIKKRLGSSSQIAVEEEFRHNVPKLMFVLLPLFAVLLFLFYKRKKYIYSAHIIFAVHYHSFAFLLLFVMNLLNLLLPYFEFNVTLFFICLFVLFLYLVFALKNVYLQSFFLSTVKAFAISISYIIFLIISLLVWALALFFLA